MRARQPDLEPRSSSVQEAAVDRHAGGGGTAERAMQAHMDALRIDFDRHAGRSLALPVAGATVWAGIGLGAAVTEPATATSVMLFGTGAIFPLGLALAALFGERLTSNPSPLASLMGRCVLMVNLLWALHLTLYAQAVPYLPLALGIGLGLHWVVFGWIIGHPLGLIHATLRTVLVTTAWWLVPDHRISAVAAAVVAAYVHSIYALTARRRGATLGAAADTAGPAPDGEGPPARGGAPATVATDPSFEAGTR